MNEKSKQYIKNLRDMYGKYNDKDSLEYLDELERVDFNTQEAVRERRAYKKLALTEKLIVGALKRYKENLHKIVNKRDMTGEERLACMVSMDWALWYLEHMGEDPESALAQVDEMVRNAAIKAGLASEELR